MSIDFSRMSAAQIENYARGRELPLGPWGNKIVGRIRCAFPGAHPNLSDWKLYLQAHHRWDRMTGPSRDRRVVESFAPSNPDAPTSDAARVGSTDATLWCPSLQNAPSPEATSDDETIELIASMIFQTLRLMDDHCPTGLGNFVSCSQYAGTKQKDEEAITWGMTEALSTKWNCAQRQHAYPIGRCYCDRVVELDGGDRLWIEVKLAWRKYFWAGDIHRSPAYGKHLKGDDHSWASDFTKIELVGRPAAKYLGVLLVGFDGADSGMTRDVKGVIERDGLHQRGWQFRQDAWQTKQCPECWIRCWFAWRDA